MTYPLRYEVPRGAEICLYSVFEVWTALERMAQSKSDLSARWPLKIDAAAASPIKLFTAAIYGFS